MDWYSLFKFVHVAAAIIWIGAGFAMVLLAIAARRATDQSEQMRVINQVVFLTPRLFMPASGIVLLAGIIAAAIAPWNTLWMWIGVLGFASTFSTGFFLIRPRADAISAMGAAGGLSEAGRALGDELLAISKFDYIVLFVVVADMVFKPGWGDWPLLLVMLAVLIGGGFAFLTPVIRKELAAYGIRI